MISLIVLVIGLFLVAPIFISIAASSGVASLKSKIRELEHSIDVLRQEIGWLRSGQQDGAGTQGSTRPSGVAPKSETPPVDKPAPEVPPASAVEPPVPMPPVASTSVPPVASAPPLAARGTPDRSGESFEQALGTKWAVWAGGIALALGGLFLVRYSIESGLLGPGVRVIMGLLLAGGLIAAGEWFRRNDVKIPIDALPQAHIPSILTAAGTVVAFGTIYAAHALYGFIGPVVAFTALGATGIFTMIAAALHGPALAGLGLAGAFIAPLLVQSASPDPWPVVLYLAVVAASAYLLARTRKWLWLACAAVAGAFVWGITLLPTTSGGTMFGLTASAIHCVLQLALAAAFLAIEPYLGQQDSKAEPDFIATAALAALTLLALLVLGPIPST